MFYIGRKIINILEDDPIIMKRETIKSINHSEYIKYLGSPLSVRSNMTIRLLNIHIERIKKMI
jgi:hypothetical protein